MNIDMNANTLTAQQFCADPEAVLAALEKDVDHLTITRNGRAIATLTTGRRRKRTVPPPHHPVHRDPEEVARISEQAFAKMRSRRRSTN